MKACTQFSNLLKEYFKSLFCGKKNILLSIAFIIVILAVYTFLLCLLGSFKVNENKLSHFLFNSSGKSVYTIEGKTQGIQGLASDYDIYTALNFPSRLQEMAKNSQSGWSEFVKMRENQDILVYEALENNILKDPNALYFVRQGLREALVKAYLYKNIPNIDKIKESKFSEDRIFLEEIYAKNKESYDKKNISKEEALKALEQVYAQKKSAIIDYLLKKEETKILNQLEKKYKIQENTELLNKKGSQ